MKQSLASQTNSKLIHWNPGKNLKYTKHITVHKPRNLDLDFMIPSFLFLGIQAAL